MACHPDLCIRVQCCHVVVEILGCIVVAVLLAQSCDQTSRVAGVGLGLTVANLSPQILAALPTAAAEKEVVVNFIVGGRLGSVKHGRRGALQADDHRRVLGIGKYVPSQPIRLPTKILCVVEATTDIFPLASIWL